VDNERSASNGRVAEGGLKISAAQRSFPQTRDPTRPMVGRVRCCRQWSRFSEL